MRRRLLQSVFLLLGLLVLAVASLASQRLADELRPAVEARLSEAIGQPVRLGQLQTIALPPGVVLRDVEVGSPLDQDGGPPALWLRLAKVRIRPHWSSLVLGHVVLAEVLAEGVALEASVGAKGAAPPAPNGAAAIGELDLEQLRQRLVLPCDVHAMRLHEADAKLWLAAGTLVLEGIFVEGDWSGMGRRQLTAQLGAGTFAPAPAGPRAKQPLAFAAAVHGELAGSWAKPRRLSLTNATFSVPEHGVEVVVAGELPLAHARPQAPLALVATAHADLTALSHKQALPANVRGMLHLQLQSLGTWANPSLLATLNGEHLGRGANGRGDEASLAAEALLTRTALVVQRAEFVPRPAPAGQGVPDGPQAVSLAGGAGRCSARGSLDFAPGTPFAGQVRLEQLDVAALAKVAGAPLPTLGGTLTGELDVRQVAAKPGVAVNVALEARDFVLREAPQPQAAADVVLGLDAVGLVAELRLLPQRLEIHAAELHRQGATVFAEGEALWGKAESQPELDLRVWAGGLPLGALGPIAKVPYEGVASFAGNLRGPLGRPACEAAVQVNHLRVAQVGLGESRGVLRFNAPTLQLLQFEGKRGSGVIRGEGAITFARGNNQVVADLQLRDWDTGECLADFGAPAAVAEQLDARLWGQVSLAGPLDRPTGFAKLQVPQLSYGPLVFGSAELACTLAQGDARLEASLVTGMATGNLAVHAGIYDAQPQRPLAKGTKRPPSPLRLVLGVVGNEVALEKVYRATEGPEVTGSLALQVDLEGPPQALSGTLVADVTHLQLGGAALGGVHVLGQAEAGVAHVDVRLLQGGARVAASLGLAKPWPLHATADFDALDGHFLLPLLSPAGQRLGRDARAILTGKATAHGELTDPASLRANLALQAVELGYHTTLLRLRRPVVLRLVRQRLLIPPTQLVDAEAQVTLAGAVPLTEGGQLDLQTDVEGDLRGLRGLLPGVTNAQGPLQLHVHLRGPLQRPELLGEFALRRAALRFAGADGQVQTLDNLGFKALFSGRGLALTNGRAQLGRGKVRFGGEVNLGSGSWRNPEGGLNVRLQLDQVPVAPIADLTTTLTGSLELGGKLDAPTLRGDLRLSALRYTARLDLNTLVPKRAAPPLRAPFSPFGRPVALGIKLHAANDLILSSKVLEAELAADLLVTGTSERIGLLGSVTPKWARARFNQNLFTISHATIDFTDEYRVSPSYSVQAHTRACDIDAEVNVQGDVDGYTVQANGRDDRGAVDPTDVWSCLNFGLRISNFSRNTRNSAGVGDALSGSIDTLWVVSGLDDKVRKLLPIHVDELKLTSGWSSLSQRTTARVLVGKDLGAKVGLRYSRSLEDNDQAFSLDYKISNLTTLQANWLSARFVPVGDFGVDTRLHWELR